MSEPSETPLRRRGRHRSLRFITSFVGAAVILSSLSYGVWQQLQHETVQTAPPPLAPEWTAVLLVALAGLVVVIGSVKVPRRG